jgi:NIMA (never in mitosis gene a)-related kinase
VSKRVPQSGFLTTQTGTPFYSSPEIWKNRPYDSKSDIWSLGCLIYEMVCLKPPFKASSMDELFRKVNKGIYAPIPSMYS